MGVMEVDDMTKEELQFWIREKVKNAIMDSPEIVKKYNVLQCLLRRQEKKAACFLKLCQEVAECEATVKDLYSRLGWLYSEIDSDYSDDGSSNINATSCVQNESGKRKLDEDRRTEREASYRSLYLQKEAVVVLTRYPEHQLGPLCSSSSVQYSPDYSMSGSDILMPNSSSKRRKMEQTHENSTKDHAKGLQALQINIQTKPSGETTTCAPQISASSKTDTNKTSSLQATKAKTGTTTLAPQASTSTKTSTNKTSSQKETKSKAGTTTLAPQTSSSTKTGTNKTSSLKESKAKSGSTTSAPQTSTSTKTNTNKTSSRKESKSKAGTTTLAPQASTSTKTGTNKTSSLEESKAKSGSTTLAPQTDTSTKTSAYKSSLPQSTANTSAKTGANKASSLQPSANSEGPAQTTTAQRQAPKEGSKPAHVLYSIKEKVTVGMTVLAKRRTLTWKPGKVLDIITNEAGTEKYKINFDDKKMLVSAHHIASDTIPVVEDTFIGARVLVSKRDDRSRFIPGVLVDVPSRANRMRFLVFMDDHTPIYVGLPLLRLLYKPLENVLDDIPAGMHKIFMKSYLKDFPFPVVIHFRIGQMVTVLVNGSYRKCEVQQVDCLLVQICFQGEEEHKEWLHRGSFRMEANKLKFAELEAKENKKEDAPPTTDARSTSKSNRKDPPLSVHSAPQSRAETNTRRRGRKPRSPGRRPPPAGSQHAEKSGP